MQSETLIERAYGHARSGAHCSVSDINKALRRDSFVRGMIEDRFGGRGIKVEMRKICREARTHDSDAGAP